MTAKPDLQPLVHGLGASLLIQSSSFYLIKCSTPSHPSPPHPHRGLTSQLLYFDDISSSASSYFTFIGMLDLLVLVFWFAASTCCWQHILIVNNASYNYHISLLTPAGSSGKVVDYSTSP